MSKLLIYTLLQHAGPVVGPGTKLSRRVTSFIRELALRQLEHMQQFGQDIPSNWSDLTTAIREEDLLVNGDDE